MTWFWFALFGIIALASRNSISGWVGNWSDGTLKQWAAAGLIGFGIMATFGLAINNGIWFLHLAGGIGGVLGFFAVNEIANRSAANRREDYEAKLRTRLAEYRSQQQAKSRKPQQAGQSKRQTGRTEQRPRREPPLITVKDSQENILDLLTAAAEQWENPEAASEDFEPAHEQPDHQTYQSVSQILARADEHEEPAVSVDAAPATVERLPDESYSATATKPGSRETSAAQLSSAEFEPAIELKNRNVAQRETDDEETNLAKLPADAPAAKAGLRDEKQPTMAREHGPISLAKSVPLRPAGPISLEPAATIKAPPPSVTTKSAGFVYQPLMVRSRLTGHDPKKASDSGDDNDHADLKQQTAADETPAAGA